MGIDAKEKTALGASVGADAGQSIQKDSDNSIPASEAKRNGETENSTESLEEMYRKMQRMADPRYLHTLTMTELFQTSYKSRPPIIENLLHSGAYLLAGAPKIGKSFLVAQIAYHVSTGQDLWGCKVHQGTVLYLALEDDFQRIQNRMFMMYGVNDTPNLHFATAAGKIGNGLDEQLENFMREHPDTKLIIIDTMQKIREVGGEAYSYASDYEIVGKLKQFADKHCICVLTVHHTRKQPAGDAFEMISGTTGLLGCADGSLLMQKKKRTALEAAIDVVGRDQQDQILYLKKDPETQIWNLERMETEPHKEPPDPVLEAVARMVNASQPEWTGSPSELATAVQVGMAANTLTKYLNVKSGRLLEEYHVGYENRARLAELQTEKSEVKAEIGQLQVNKAEAEKATKEAQTELRLLALKLKSMEKLAAEYSSDPEDLLPLPDRMESAKSYREKKSKPLLEKIVKVVRSVYRAYLDVCQKFELLQRKYDTEVPYLKKQLDKVKGENAELQETVRDYHRLCRAYGPERVAETVAAVKQQEQAEKEQKRSQKRRHDREER